jgi:hypothetical protein
MLFLPQTILSFLVSKLISFPSDAANVTATFLKSRNGVRQALHLARDEMDTITADVWDTEIWGAAEPSPHTYPRPILRFLFAASDHWVAKETRDDLIRERGMNSEGEDWKPMMEVDEEEGWPHGFCIRHSIPVAERVKGYIDDIVLRDSRRSYPM